jgi:hypothetical protein
MKRVQRILTIALIGGMLIIGYALPVYASCTTHTISSGGRIVMCTTCCYFNQCYTNCF